MTSKTIACTYPSCGDAAVAWYRWIDLEQGPVFEVVCAEHAKLIREHVSVFLGRGRVVNGVAEGAGSGV